MTKRAAAPTRRLDVGPFTGEATAWDTFVRQASGASFCHLSGWRRVMAEGLGHETELLVATDEDGHWRGVLPLVHVRSRLFGSYLVSMPFLNYGGPLGEEDARIALATAAVERARARRVDLLELRTREALPEGTLSASNRKITVLLPLPDSADTLWDDGFRSKLRSQIRRPQKEGMEAAFGAEHLDAFYAVFATNMRDLGTPVLPRRFFESIVTTFGDVSLIGCVYANGQPVAAGFGFAWGDELEITWASSLRSHDRFAPNMLLYWEFMKHAIARSIPTFNFGRCTPDSGTHRFKLQWGGHDAALPWCTWSPGDVASTPTPDGRFMRLAVAGWRRIPLAIANRLGPRISRNLP